jgi:hypothetical protein
MKLALFDPYLGKFSPRMIKWWEANGYEVRAERYYNPELVRWADVVYFFTCDNNLKMATNPPVDNPDFQGYDIHEMDLTNKKIIVAPVDIEVWEGHQHASKWDVVDDVIFMAPHIQEVFGDVQGMKANVHLIPFCIDLDDWTFKEREHGFDIAVVSERWVSKGSDLILQIAYKLKQIDPRYKIHWLGQLSPHWAWEHAYMNDFIEHNGLNIEITNILLDGLTVDEWLEDKNYLLHASKKEAFSAATAEAMAKGIKPVIHRFFGADWLWENTWNSVDEAIEMITGGEYDSNKYRQYILDKGYDLHSMMQSINKVIREE